MYSAKNISPRRIETPATKIPAAWHRKRMSRVITACAAIALCSLTIRASASTTIYLYDTNGTPVNVTASYVYQEHYLYDSLGNRVGSVNSSGSIFNLSNQKIGYIDTTPGNPTS